MSEADILKVIAEWLQEHSGIAPERVQMDASIADELLLDSLDQVEVVMAMEERFQVEIDDETAGQWKTVGDIVSFLAACQSPAPDPFLRAS
jgi:acyl carrier protein